MILKSIIIIIIILLSHDEKCAGYLHSPLHCPFLIQKYFRRCLEACDSGENSVEDYHEESPLCYSDKQI